MITVIAQLVLAIFLFFAVNWIGEHSSTFGYLQLSLVAKENPAPAFNFALKTLAPTAYIILAATIFYVVKRYRFVDHIWFVVIYYFASRFLYNIILGRARLLPWFSMLAQAAVGIATAYLAYVHIILPQRPLLPGVESIGNQLWIIIALFLYAVLNNVQLSSARAVRRKNNYLRLRFEDLRKQYGELIDGQFPEKYMELVTYSVLIYETFNRPWAAQLIERITFPWRSHTLGPMQVHTKTRISDRESVAIGTQQLRTAFAKTNDEQVGKTASRSQIISMALAKYNRDENYIYEVFAVLHVLWAQVATEYRNEFEMMYHPAIVVKAVSAT